MTTINTFVPLTITTQTTGVDREGFGTPMVIGYFPTSIVAARSKAYTSLADMVTDGFTVNHPVYLACAAIQAQNPKVSTWKVGRRALAFSQAFDLVPANTDEGYVYSFTVRSPDGTLTTITHTNGASETVATLCTALQTPLNAITGLSASDDTTDVSCTADNNGELFLLDIPDDGALEYTDVTADPGIATDLAAIAAEDNNWYGGLLDSNGEAEILAAAAWFETQRKLFIVSSSDAGIHDSGSSTDVAADLQTAAYERTALIRSSDQDGFAAARWMGKLFPYDPGAATWAYKTLAGLDADALQGGQFANIVAKDANHYSAIKGVNVTYPGQVASGEWIDVVRGIDWTHARLQERIFALMVNLLKIPFTNAGVALVKAEIEAQYFEGVNNGLFSPDVPPIITAPRVENVSAANKIARTLPDVNFTFTLAGAVHIAQITGVVTV